MIYKNNKGITLMALIVIVIVLLIIAGVSIYEGKDLIVDAKVETVETNMLAIKAKAKMYAEEVEAKTWTNNENNNNDVFIREYSMNSTNINNSAIISQIGIDSESKKYYSISNFTLAKMGLSDLQEDNEVYVIVLDSDDYSKIDVIYTPGVKYLKHTYYTLSAIQKVFDEK